MASALVGSEQTRGTRNLKLPLDVGVVPVAGRCTFYLPTEMKRVSERAEEDEEEHKKSFFIS
jgi:hypothetical protein